MRYKVNTSSAVLLSLLMLNGCTRANDAIPDSGESTTSDIHAVYAQSHDSVINHGQKYYTSDDNKSCIRLSGGAELILSESEAMSGGSSEGGDASAVKASDDSRIILEGCKVSAFGHNSSAVSADGAEIVMSGGAAFTDGNSSPAVRAVDGASVSLTGLSLNSYGESSDAANVTDSSIIIKSSSVGAVGASSAALRQNGGSCELTDSTILSDKGSTLILYDAKADINGVKLRAPFSCALEADSAEIRISGGSAEYGEAFAKLTGSFLLNIEGTDLLSPDKDFLRITDAASGEIKVTNAHVYGIIDADSDSRVRTELYSSEYSGAINPESANAAVTLVLDDKSKWLVSGTSYLTALVTASDSLICIDSNGYDVYYSAENEDNDWLGGEVHALEGGGRLIPR